MTVWDSVNATATLHFQCTEDHFTKRVRIAAGVAVVRRIRRRTHSKLTGSSREAQRMLSGCCSHAYHLCLRPVR
jgi:hypothetical protein